MTDQKIWKLPVIYQALKPWERRSVREQYVKIQEGKCHHCGVLLTEEPSEKVRAMKVNKSYFPEGFFNHPVHLHHNHVTGLTIGAVHCYCNAVLWQYHGE